MSTLVDSGAEVQTLCPRSDDLYYAFSIRNMEVVKMLLEAGADVNVRKSDEVIASFHEACMGFF